MANPLARVVMNNIAQKSGMVEKRSSKAKPQNNGSVNLGRKETQLLSSLLNNTKSVTTTGSSSYNKNTYGRSTSVSNAAANTMKTLSSLVSNKSTSTERNERDKSCNIDKARPDLRSLCNLDNISVGKTNVKTEDRNVMKKLNLNELVNSNVKINKKEDRTSYKKQTSGMTTLGDLAKEKTKNSNEDESNTKRDNVTTSNSYVKSNVINNLEAYIPKVTLESIGKKGSLF